MTKQTTWQYGIIGVLIVTSIILGTLLVREKNVHTALKSAHEATLAELDAARSNAAATTATLEARIGELSMMLGSTSAELATTQSTRDAISKDLIAEKERNEDFEDQIKDITGTVGKLDKLAKTDPEILQKYSKVFFLNEHYMPEKLSEIDTVYRYKDDEPEFIASQVYPFLTEMIDDALEDGVKLWVVSAFRSYDEQEDLKGAYTVTYGSGANTFSADQGYSEHQLGTTVDFTTEGLGGGLSNFETANAYIWLTENAHRYGFVLSYPKDNAYYVFEPWHWRFVGTDLAKDLHKSEKHFYDLDQREIDEYLISVFD